MSIFKSTKYQLLNKENVCEENSVDQSSSKYKWAILGGFCALSSSLIFTFYGLLIKQFDADFVDVLFVRSWIQIIVISFVVKIRQKNLFPVFEIEDDKWLVYKKYSILILQVRFFWQI